MDGQRSVLIVDESEETREVLQTALERRGMRTFAAGQAHRGLELARRHHPDLIVLDMEIEDAGSEGLFAPLAEESPNDGPRLVLLGTVSRTRQPPLHGEFVAKPYHYAPLIRRIEQLLETAKR